MSINTRTATATIAISTSLSGAIFLGDGLLSAISMPAAWDAADITFQVSDDRGVTWYELQDSNGNAITLSAPAAAKRYGLNPSDFKDAQFLKLRSGTSGSAVNQTAARAITVISRKYYPVS